MVQHGEPGRVVDDAVDGDGPGRRPVDVFHGVVDQPPAVRRGDPEGLVPRPDPRRHLHLHPIAVSAQDGTGFAVLEAQRQRPPAGLVHAAAVAARQPEAAAERPDLETVDRGERRPVEHPQLADVREVQAGHGERDDVRRRYDPPVLPALVATPPVRAVADPVGVVQLPSRPAGGGRVETPVLPHEPDRLGDLAPDHRTSSSAPAPPRRRCRAYRAESGSHGDASPAYCVDMKSSLPFVIPGVILAVLGLVWLLQGVDVLGGSAMSGSPLWATVGPIVLVVGLALIVIGIVRRRRAR